LRCCFGHYSRIQLQKNCPFVNIATRCSQFFSNPAFFYKNPNRFVPILVPRLNLTKNLPKVKKNPPKVKKAANSKKNSPKVKKNPPKVKQICQNLRAKTTEKIVWKDCGAGEANAPGCRVRNFHIC
jgi:hypothetical protein